MGFDVVAFVNGIWQSQYGLLALLSGALFVALWVSGFFNRLFKIIEEMMFSNWQLALLGATAIALSLASGYTTFDGLRNFTSAPLLSVLIAFGIQGVMLIVAWLIGESFATGMNQRSASGKGLTAREATVGMLLGVALAGLAFYWLLNQYSAVGFTRASGLVADWGRFADVALYFLHCGRARRRHRLQLPARRRHLHALRAERAPDRQERGVVGDVPGFDGGLGLLFLQLALQRHFLRPSRKSAPPRSARSTRSAAWSPTSASGRRRFNSREAERLFETDGWKAYDTQLTRLAQQAQGSQGEIEKYFVTKMEERRRGIAEQQERISGAERNQTALLRRRDELEAELQRIEPGIGAFEAELAKAQGTYNATKQAIAAKRIEANAEDGGVEGTLKRGRGPVFRQRTAEAEELQRKLVDHRRAAPERGAAPARPGIRPHRQPQARDRHHQRRCRQVQGRDPDRGAAHQGGGKLRGRRGRHQDRSGPRAAGLRARTLSLPPAAGYRAAGRPPDPVRQSSQRHAEHARGQGARARHRLRSQSRGRSGRAAVCVECRPRGFPGDVCWRLQAAGERHHRRRCWASGASVCRTPASSRRNRTDLGERLQAIDMNRDDKAHRFVVTWNAFQDGNRLAYLALVLAIGVDALVFMAGLFGAASVKSPLSDVPSFKARSAEQLQAVIDTALLPHTYENAQAVLNAMRPMAPDGGFTQRIAVHDDDPHARDLHRVLNAGATIGAVRHVAGETYELRSELFEYISQVAKKAFAADKSHVALADLERIVAVALLPDVKDNVETVLKYVHPIEDRPTLLEKVGLKERHDFTAEIKLDEVDRNEKKVVRNALNAGATMEAVQRASNSHYYISRDFYKTLARIRGRFLVSAAPEALLARHEASRPLLSARADASTLTPLVTSGARTHRDSIADNRGRLLENHQAGNGRADRDLETYFRHELVKPLGVSAASLDHVWESEVAAEALGAANALKRQARQRPALNSELRRVEGASRRVLEEGSGHPGRPLRRGPAHAVSPA